MSKDFYGNEMVAAECRRCGRRLGYRNFGAVDEYLGLCGPCQDEGQRQYDRLVRARPDLSVNELRAAMMFWSEIKEEGDGKHSEKATRASGKP